MYSCLVRVCTHVSQAIILTLSNQTIVKFRFLKKMFFKSLAGKSLILLFQSHNASPVNAAEFDFWFFFSSFLIPHVSTFPAAIAPDRRLDFANCGFRALIAASVACFMTACIAGDRALRLAPTPRTVEQPNSRRIRFPHQILITIFGAHLDEYSSPYVMLTAKTTKVAEYSCFHYSSSYFYLDLSSHSGNHAIIRKISISFMAFFVFHNLKC